MIKIALCDDNLKSIQSIGKIIESIIIQNCMDAEIILITDNQDEIYHEMENKNIDVLLLDVDFKNGGKNGIDFAVELRKINKTFNLIFLTAHFEYSMISFKCKTFDYLLKPVTQSSLNDLFLRIKNEFESPDNNTFVKINRGLCVRSNDILFVERKFNKSYVHTKNNTFVSSLGLNSLLDKLPDHFDRNHRAYIVNKNAIARIDRTKKSIIFDSINSCPLGGLTTKL